jgi:hypothetical protein
MKCLFRKLNNYAPNDIYSGEEFLDCIGAGCVAYRESIHREDSLEESSGYITMIKKTKWCCGALPQEVWQDVAQEEKV